MNDIDGALERIEEVLGFYAVRKNYPEWSMDKHKRGEAIEPPVRRARQALADCAAIHAKIHDDIDIVLTKPINGCRDLTAEDEIQINELYRYTKLLQKICNKGKDNAG